ncbi:MAG: outer membrane lipoprotein carrier protein LolA [Verrucomicrobiales bacterium]|nr:outer membrane lipoprotein carrier protein LolA [Verrucomicrobiales bacterium]
MGSSKFVAAVAAALLASGFSGAFAADLSIVEKWMGNNSGARTLKVSFSQTRTMKSIRVPIRQSGTLWIDYGRSRFRMEMGNPAQTIVTRQGSSMVITRPLGKKYEKRAYGSGSDPAMASLSGGVPRSMSEFKRKYRVISTDLKGSTYHIVTQPLGSSGRGVSTFTFLVKKDSFNLSGMEIRLKDGSYVSTTFRSVTPNASMPSSLFTQNLDGYTQTKF